MPLGGTLPSLEGTPGVGPAEFPDGGLDDDDDGESTVSASVPLETPTASQAGGASVAAGSSSIAKVVLKEAGSARRKELEKALSIAISVHDPSTVKSPSEAFVNVLLLWLESKDVPFEEVDGRVSGCYSPRYGRISDSY